MVIEWWWLTRFEWAPSGNRVVMKWQLTGNGVVVFFERRSASAWVAVGWHLDGDSVVIEMAVAWSVSGDSLVLSGNCAVPRA